MSDLLKFSQLGLSEKTLQALEKKGFEEPTKIQEQCIPLLLKDQVDVIGQAQTGTGKTAAFGLPILEIVDPDCKDVQALILAPTRELAIQVSDEITSLKGDRHLDITAIYGGASMELQLKKLRRGVQIVVGTPGRIQDHLKRGTLKLDHLRFAVLDEADEMLDMGFIEDIENILSQTPDKKRMLCFSATMPDPILKLARKFMESPTIVRVENKDLTSSLTDQIYFEVRESDKLEALCRIVDMEDDFYGLVFCRTKVQCDEIGRKLQERGYDAEALHGDLSQAQREKILRRMKDHLLSILVATDVAARGIDINDLTHVINYSIPQDPEAYIHRVGRTGRAGKMGTAITFITPQEFRKFKFIKRVSNAEIRKEEVPAASDVVSIKKERIHNSLVQQMESGEDCSQFLPFAQELLKDREADQVLSSILSHFYKDELDVTRYKDIKLSAKNRERNEGRNENRRSSNSSRRDSYEDDDNGTVRLFIARGRKDGLEKRDLIDYLIERTDAADADIQNVAVRDEFSFVTAPLAVAERIITTLNENAPDDRPIVTKARPDNPNGKHMYGHRDRGENKKRSNSFHKDRDRRDRHSFSWEDERRSSKKSKFGPSDKKGHKGKRY